MSSQDPKDQAQSTGATQQPWSASTSPTSLTLGIPTELISSGHILSFMRLFGEGIQPSRCENCGCNEVCGCKKDHCCENKCSCDAKQSESRGIELITQPAFLEVLAQFMPDDLNTVKDFQATVERVRQNMQQKSASIRNAQADDSESTAE